MPWVGILPYAIFENKVYILLGKEHPEIGWLDGEKWAHFGGGSELTDPNIKAGCAREGYEESMGFLGSEGEILANLDDNMLIKLPKIYCYLVPIQYNAMLPKIYSNVYQYLTKCMVKHPRKTGFNYISSCPDGYLEKTAIAWVEWYDLKRRLEYKDSTLRPGFLLILTELFRKFKLE